MADPLPAETSAPHQAGARAGWIAQSVPFLALILALAGSLSYWPGLVTWDSLRQYDQALSGRFDDWHPPVMEWLWRQMLPLAHSPWPMLLLQLGLYAAGFVMIVRALSKSRRPGVSLAVVCCALQPIVIALMATIIKDSLMTGALLCAVGLVATAERRPASRRIDWRRGLALFLCLFAATLRFNGFLAILPIALWALPPHFRSNWRRALGSALVLTPLLVVAMPVANAVIGAEKSGVQLSLIIFDLGGITEHSGENQFQPMGIADPVAVNHRCYSPVKWDSYSWWVAEICPINFDRVRRAIHDGHLSPAKLWLTAVLHHPLAYVQHRAAHWNINARFWVTEEVERPVQVEAPANEWHFAVTPNPGVGIVDAAALASARTPLGWPWAWMMAMALLLWNRRRRPYDMVAMLATSALLYGLGYSVFSVASELRYYLWTMCAGGIAILLAINEDRRAVS